MTRERNVFWAVEGNGFGLRFYYYYYFFFVVESKTHKTKAPTNRSIHETELL